MRILTLRFWDRVLKTPTCWLWTAATNNSGYGSIKVNGQTIGAHCCSWEMAYGPIPDGLWVLHRCDVRLCVRPDHLFLGTPTDNIADARSKGRLATGDLNGLRLHPEKVSRGERRWNAKLTTSDVERIRSEYLVSMSRRDRGELRRRLADEFQVHPNTINKIAAGRAWRVGW